MIYELVAEVAGPAGEVSQRSAAADISDRTREGDFHGTGKH